MSFQIVEGLVRLFGKSSGNIAEVTAADALKTDSSHVTQPVSASSLPLPTGAATESTLTAIRDTVGIKKITDPLPTGDNVLGKSKIVGAISGNVAEVTAGGQLQVYVIPPTPPPGTTSVDVGEQGTAAKSGGSNSFSWTIPNGQSFKLQQFYFSAYIVTTGSDKQVNAKCDLYVRPNGAGSAVGQQRIRTLYLHRSSIAVATFNDLTERGGVTFVGNGTKVLYMNVLCPGPGDIEFENAILGYY